MDFFGGYRSPFGYENGKNGGDVIAKMKNHNGEPVVLQRGEAISGENGNVIVSGRPLQHQTGTARNYGLNKIIYKHGVPRGEVVKIPRYIKDNPLEITPRNQSVYSVKKIDGEMRVITTPRNGYETISSMYSKTR